MKPLMSDVLCDADPSIQIKGRYLIDWDKKTKKAKGGYCALGFLACKSKSVDEFGVINAPIDWLLEKYETTEDNLSKLVDCHLCDKLKGYKLVHTIPHWNDVHALSFKEIASILKEHNL